MADNVGSDLVGLANVDRVNAIVLPVFCFLAIFFTILSVRHFYKVKNFPALNIVLVNDLLCLQYLANAMIWRTDDINTWFHGQGFCDIQAATRTPLTVSLAFSLLRLTRTLANALDFKNAEFGNPDARVKRKWIFDILWCWVVPLFQVALSFLVMAGRYEIHAVYGCLAVLDNTWLSVLVHTIWFPYLMAHTVYYSNAIIFRIFRHRRNIGSALQYSGSSMTDRQYLKVVILAVILISVYVPCQCLFFKNDLPILPIENWTWKLHHRYREDLGRASWDLILFGIGEASIPWYQYYGWAPVAWNILMFLFYSLNWDTWDTCRGFAAKIGLAKIFPSLREPRQPRQQTDATSAFSRWLSKKLDITGRLLYRIENSSWLNAIEDWVIVRRFIAWRERCANGPSFWVKVKNLFKGTGIEQATTPEEIELDVLNLGNWLGPDLSQRTSGSTFENTTLTDIEAQGSSSRTYRRPRPHSRLRRLSTSSTMYGDFLASINAPAGSASFC